jgi:guanylate kinase
MIFVISGPSGSGKSTMVDRVVEMEKNVRFSVSHTTRPSRRGEVDGEDYYFLTEDRFEEMIAAGEFAEYARVHGHYYGTSNSELKNPGTSGDVLLDIDVQGAGQLRQSSVEAVFVFILPPSYSVLRDRLEKRCLDSRESIARRLANAREEILHYDRFDFVIINDVLEQAVIDLQAVIRSQRCRKDGRRVELEAVIESFNREI